MGGVCKLNNLYTSVYYSIHHVYRTSEWYILAVLNPQNEPSTLIPLFWGHPGYCVLSQSPICSSLGEYVKDVDDILLPREPLLDQKFPRPVVERGYCRGIWATIDDDNQNKRDCNDEYPQPLSAFGSDVELGNFSFLF